MAQAPCLDNKVISNTDIVSKNRGFIFPPLQKRSRISKALKLSFADWQVELRKQLLSDESSVRKYIKENGDNWTDDGGRRYRMIIGYVAINELQNAINFINYIEKDYPGSGGCYFEIAKVLIHLKQCKLYKKDINETLLNQYYQNVMRLNTYVWNLLETESFVSNAMDQYFGGAMRGSSTEAHNIVETCLKTFQHTPGAMTWLRNKLKHEKELKCEKTNNNNNQTNHKQETMDNNSNNRMKQEKNDNNVNNNVNNSNNNNINPFFGNYYQFIPMQNMQTGAAISNNAMMNGMNNNRVGSSVIKSEKSEMASNNINNNNNNKLLGNGAAASALISEGMTSNNGNNNQNNSAISVNSNGTIFMPSGSVNSAFSESPMRMRYNNNLPLLPNNGYLNGLNTNFNVFAAANSTNNGISAANGLNGVNSNVFSSGFETFNNLPNCE